MNDRQEPKIANIGSTFLNFRGKTKQRKFSLTVVVFGKASPESLALLALGNLSGLDISVTLKSVSCKKQRKSIREHVDKTDDTFM